MALLDVRDLTRSFYGIHALGGVDLRVEAHRITGLIGPNGAGKTTLFNCISGVVAPDSGTVIFDGRDITGWRPDRISSTGLIRTFQIARGFPRLSVYENLLLYGPNQPGERLTHAILRSPAARHREAELRERANAIAQRHTPARRRRRGSNVPPGEFGTMSSRAASSKSRKANVMAA